MNLIEANLNEKQLEAVQSLNGPLLIFAGAGSGKTRVITWRIANLIDNGVNPYDIMAVTFTNKATKEMKERIKKIIGRNSNYVFVSTFHSACARLLRKYSHEIGFTADFSIYDDKDRTNVLKEVLIKMGDMVKHIKPQDVVYVFDEYKNSGLTPDMISEQIKQRYKSDTPLDNKMYGKFEKESTVYKIYAEYQKKLKELNAMDFNDLLLYTVMIFETKPHILAQLQARLKYFMVDEFQDTNPIQFKFIQLLSSHTKNLCIVGDDDQSIYSWRGAEPDFILNFQKYYPETKIIKLEQNYRSTKNIINAASELIANNKKRAPKSLWTSSADGEKIKFIKNYDNHQEANNVCKHIINLIANDAKLNDIAILYRTNAQSRLLEDELRRKMLPYIVHGSVRFYERAEIKLLLSYLKLLINPDDDQAFIKAISAPKRGIGDKALEKLQEIADNHKISMFRASCRMAINEISDDIGRGSTNLKDFANSFLILLKSLEADISLSDVISQIITKQKIDEYIRHNYAEDFDDRLSNITELRNALIDYEDKQVQEDGDISSPIITSKRELLSLFLQQVQLVVEPTAREVAEGKSEAITMMTIHASKGLEFKHVIITGIEEGTLPHIRSLNNNNSLEEERRLLYVAITRAQVSLALFASTYDVYNRMPKEVSRFIDEIPFIKEEKSKVRFSDNSIDKEKATLKQTKIIKKFGVI